MIPLALNILETIPPNILALIEEAVQITITAVGMTVMGLQAGAERQFAGG